MAPAIPFFCDDFLDCFSERLDLTKQRRTCKSTKLNRSAFFATGEQERFIAQKTCDAKPYLASQTALEMTGLKNGFAVDHSP